MNFLSRVRGTRPVRLIERVLRAHIRNDVSLIAAGLTFHGLLALGPLIVLLVLGAGLLLEKHSVREAVLSEVGARSTPDIADTIAETLGAWRPDFEESIWAAIGSVLVLLWLTSRLFANVRVALDRVWENEAATAQANWRRFASGRAYGVAILLGLSMIVAASLAAKGWVAVEHGAYADALVWTEPVVSIGIMSGVLMLVFRRLPAARVSRAHAWRGALVTSLLLALGMRLATTYAQYGATASVPGAAGTVLVLMLWLYFVAQAFLIGAEFTWALHSEENDADAASKAAQAEAA